MLTVADRTRMKSIVAKWDYDKSFDSLDLSEQNEIHNIVDEEDFDGNLKTVVCGICTHKFCSKCFFGYKS